MAWSTDDEIWLLGDPAFDAEALAGSELAWRRGIRGGVPKLDVAAAARVVAVLAELARQRRIGAAHDCSVGGIGVALARIAIGAGIGARIELAAASDEVSGAAAFGERAGRVVVAVPVERVADFRSTVAAAGIPASFLGVAGGDELDLRVGSAHVNVSVVRLTEGWRPGF